MVKVRREVLEKDAEACCYLLHFPDGSHYIGHTSKHPLERLRRHCGGSGSRWVARRAARVGLPVLGAVMWVGSRSSARALERKLKNYRKTIYEKCGRCECGF
jgi:predicted GIY-YIG superfamily endonuclease